MQKTQDAPRIEPHPRVCGRQLPQTSPSTAKCQGQPELSIGRGNSPFGNLVRQGFDGDAVFVPTIGIPTNSYPSASTDIYQQSNVALSRLNVASSASKSARRFDSAAAIKPVSLSHAPDCACEASSGNEEGVQQLRSIVSELVTALAKTLKDDCDAAEECLRRAAAILDEGGPPRPPVAPVQGCLAAWQVRRVTAYVETNLDKPIRNDDLAAVARLSPCHFNRAFRNSVGAPPHLYIIRRRIERAQGLMLSTDSTLSEIAAECGLADQAHFSRLFRRLAGDSPAVWRRARVSPRV
jgi:AraC family transcriptional regulator